MPLIRRRTLLAAPVLLLARRARAEHYPAHLCADCSWGSKDDNCTKCGKWMGSTRIPARLCGEHGFGSRKDNCAKLCTR